MLLGDAMDIKVYTIEQLIELIKLGKEKTFYKSGVWLSKRSEILKRDNNECQRCKIKGKYSKAETVHHIKHLKDYPELAVEDKNLISLCNSCHNEEHPEKTLNFNQRKVRVISKEKW